MSEAFLAIFPSLADTLPAKSEWLDSTSAIASVNSFLIAASSPLALVISACKSEVFLAIAVVLEDIITSYSASSSL